MPGMSDSERRKFVRFYLGVSQGFVAGISDIRALETFCIKCKLEVDPRTLQGTNREKFEQILRECSPAEQATIIRAMLDRFPPNEELFESRTEDLHDELLAVADLLEGCTTVKAKKPVFTSTVVDGAIDDAEELIGKRGFPSAVDRVHTMLHGYLRVVCDDVGITYGDKVLMSGLFSLIRGQHPAFVNVGPRKEDLDQIFRGMSRIMDAMNPIRNAGSMAHPNKELLDHPEAALVVNMARTILHYIDMKLSA